MEVFTWILAVVAISDTIIAITTQPPSSSPVVTDTIDPLLLFPDVSTRSVMQWVTILLLLVLILLAHVYFQPSWLMNLLVRHSHPSVLWCVSTTKHVCSLTIDDAPSDVTPMILDILREHNIKATFFIISGNIKGREHVLRRMVIEGHTLGNHLTEDRASIKDELYVFEQKLRVCDQAIYEYQSLDDQAIYEYQSLDDQERVIDKNDVVIDEDDRETDSVTAHLLASDGAKMFASYGTNRIATTKWLRPASGWFNTKMREIITRHGYRICLGSVYPHDAQIKFAFLNALYLRFRTRPGSVIIVHNRPWTIDVLRTALPKIKHKFEFVSLDELTTYDERN